MLIVERASSIECQTKVEQDVIAQIATDIGEFYGLPDEIMQRGKETEALIVEPNVLFQEIEQYKESWRNYLNGLAERTSRKTRSGKYLLTQIENALKERFQPLPQEKLAKIGGLFCHYQDGKRVIFLNSNHDVGESERTFMHELIHSMGHTGNNDGATGLRTPVNQLGFSVGAPLNEGVTDLLAITYIYGRGQTIASTNELAEKIIQDDFAHINPEALALFVAIRQSGFDGHPTVSHALAKYYFGLQRDEREALDLIGAIHKQSSEQNKDFVWKILMQLV